MKLSATVFLSVFALIHGAAIEGESLLSSKIAVSDTLFENAWNVQIKITELQQDINEKMTAIRTSVSTVLKSSTNVTLEQIESNANQILADAEPTRAAIFSTTLSATVCIVKLREILNQVTEFTGFGSSNCVTKYDFSVNGALDNAYAFLQKYEGILGEVQQVVVRSFNGRNVFLQADEIEAHFEKEYENKLAEWEFIRPDVESFVTKLQSNIEVFNTVLGSCFKNIQDNVKPTFASIKSELATCSEFDNTADPFVVFRE